MKKLVIILITILLVMTLCLQSIRKPKEDKTTDSYIRDRVVLLTGNDASCTGIQIKAPSGKAYTLTAAHCRVLIEDNQIDAQSESGNKVPLDVISIDPEHDLMLLSNADGKSIDVAANIHEHEHVNTITHGNRYPSYRTDGELLEERTLHIMGEPIFSEEDMSSCPVTKYSGPVFNEFGLFCAITITVHVTTALVVPGSSGGPALDDSGKLIGIVSCSANPFSGLIPLHDIQDFLKDK